MQYSDRDLSRLHAELMDVLRETVRVCNVLGVKYFALGGTAIGALCHKGIIPWDDDIDLGMTRDQYDLFLKNAGKILAPGYSLQCFETEPMTLFYFAKIRKDNTLFLEEQYKDLDIHHGIFVDIFPFDKVPDCAFLEKMHRRAVNYLHGSFKRSILKECIRESMHMLPSEVADFLTKIRFFTIRLLPRKYLYRRLCAVQGMFNGCRSKRVNIARMPLDHIPCEDLEHMDWLQFGDIELPVPGHLDEYLHHHYRNFDPWPPEEQRVNHAPMKLSFNTSDASKVESYDEA